MQLIDLIKPMDQMTDEELIERLKQIRHNRTVERPAAKAREKKSEKKGATGRIQKATDLFDKLSPADKERLKAELLKELGG